MKKIFWIIAAATLAASACSPVEKYITKPTDIVLSVSDKYLHSSQFEVEIVPADDEVFYFCDVIEKGKITPEAGKNTRFMQLTLDSLYRDYIDWRYELLKADSRYVASFSDHCLYYGKDSRFFVDLKPETEYMVYAYCVNPDYNQPMGELYYTYVKTKARTQSSMTFEWSIKGTKVMVIPSNDDEYYMFLLGAVEDVVEYFGTPEEYMDYAIETYQSMGLVKDYLSQGIDEYDYAAYLTDGVEYYVMMAGYDGELTTKVFIDKFTYREN